MLCKNVIMISFFRSLNVKKESDYLSSENTISMNLSEEPMEQENIPEIKPFFTKYDFNLLNFFYDDFVFIF